MKFLKENQMMKSYQSSTIEGNVEIIQKIAERLIDNFDVDFINP